ncbi:MAG: hypothetical protein MJ169_07245 [Treponema sp.]|nr:hypothetical protein [Treponema sp.]
MVASIIWSVIVFIGFMILCIKKLNKVNENVSVYYLLISIVLIPVLFKIHSSFALNMSWYEGPIFQVFAILITLTALYKENVTQIYGTIICIFLTCIGFYVFEGGFPLKYYGALGGIAIGHLCTVILNIVFTSIYYDSNRLTYSDFADKYL